MRQRLVRSTVLAVVLSVIIVGLPLFLAAWYGVADDAQVLREWLNSQRHSGQILMILAAIVVLSVIAVAVGVLVASRQARQFAEPMTGLAERAERLGAGQSRLEPLRLRHRRDRRGLGRAGPQRPAADPVAGLRA